MRLSRWLRRAAERGRLIAPRRGRQDVWDALDRGGMAALGRVKSASISAVVTRANGQVEDLGVIAELESEE